MPDVFSSQVGAVYEYSTRVEMASTSNASHAYRLAWCDETGGIHEFVPNDVSQPDGWVVIASTGTQQGNWLFRSEEFVLSPKGGGVDDWPTLVGSLMPAAAYKKSIRMLAGTWQCKSAHQVPSGTTLCADPGVKVVSSLVPSGQQTQSVFLAISTASAGTTLNGPVTIGSTSFSVADATPLTQGMWIEISGATNLGSYYQIVGIVENTVTVEREILFPFPNGGAVVPKTPPMDIQIFGNGMLVSGTGDRAIEISGGLRCLVDNVRVDASSGDFSDIAMSFDIGSVLSRFSRCSVDAGALCIGGISLESGERCEIFSSSVRNVSNGIGVGIYLPDCYDCDVIESHAFGCTLGLSLETGGSTTGCRGCSIVGGTYRFNSSHGVRVINGSYENTLDGVISTDNGGNGIYIQNGTGTTQRTSLIGVIADNNAGSGLQVVAGVLETNVTNCIASSNTQYGIDAGGDVQASNFRSVNCGLGGIQMSGAANLVLSGATLDATQNGVWDAFVGSTTGECVVTGFRTTMSGTGNKAVLDCSAAGIWYFENCKSTGGTFGIYMGHAVACKLKRGTNVDFSSTGTPFTIDATARANFGTFVANGATGVVVNGYFPADDAIAISFNTLGGAQGAQPTVTSKAANTFTVAATAGDTSTYDWKAA